MFTVICPLPSHPSSIFSVECTNSDLLKGFQCAYTVRWRVCPFSMLVYTAYRESCYQRAWECCLLARSQQEHSIPQLNAGFFFFLNQPFPLYCCPTSSHFHSTERTKMCRSPGLRLVCVCFFHLNPEATLTEFGQDYEAHLANREEDLDRDWRVNLSLQQSGVKWKNFWSMCFTHVLRVPDEWNLTQDSAIFIRRYQNSPDDNKLVLVSCWFVLYSVI